MQLFDRRNPEFAQKLLELIEGRQLRECTFRHSAAAVAFEE
jgi:hypothetical protein